MATIQRNVKTFGTRNFVAEVAAAPLNYAPILSNEVDADLDTVYAAWNGGTDTVNLKDGSVTFAKLAADAQLWRDTGTTLTPGANYTNRPIVAGTGNAVAFLWGSTAIKNRLKDVGASGLQLLSNSDGVTNDDAAKPSWILSLNPGSDVVDIYRGPAAATPTFAQLLRVDSVGTLTAAGHVRAGKAYASGISASANSAVGVGAVVTIPYTDIWFNSGGQNLPNPGLGLLFTPTFATNVFVIYADVNFSANGNLGCALGIQYSPDGGGVWYTVATTASKDQLHLTTMAMVPIGSGNWVRSQFTNATGLALNIGGRFLAGVSVGGW